MIEVKKGARVTGAVRDQLGAQLVKKYTEGASIRVLAAQTGRSYGFIHRVLIEAGAPLRGRGGNNRTRHGDDLRGRVIG